MQKEYPWDVQDAESYVSEAQDRLQNCIEDIFDEERVGILAREALSYLRDAVASLEKILSN